MDPGYQCFAGQALAVAEAPELLDAQVAFVGSRLLEDGSRLVPAYIVTGGQVSDERSLNLPGYPGGYGVVGNHVNVQFQLDA